MTVVLGVCRIVDDYCYPYVRDSVSAARPGARCPLPRSHLLLAAAKRCPYPGSPVRVYHAAPPYTVSPTVSIPLCTVLYILKFNKRSK